MHRIVAVLSGASALALSLAAVGCATTDAVDVGDREQRTLATVTELFTDLSPGQQLQIMREVGRDCEMMSNDELRVVLDTHRYQFPNGDPDMFLVYRTYCPERVHKLSP